MPRHKPLDEEFDTLDVDQLDEVTGGGGGIYGQVNGQVAGNGGSYIVTFGSDGVHAYQAPQVGVGDGVSVSAGGGTFTSQGAGSNFWTGPSTNVSVGAQEGGTAAVARPACRSALERR